MNRLGWVLGDMVTKRQKTHLCMNCGICRYQGAGKWVADKSACAVDSGHEWGTVAELLKRKEDLKRVTFLSVTHDGKVDIDREADTSKIEKDTREGIPALTTNREWMLRKAAEEDNCLVSVGGLVLDLQQLYEDAYDDAFSTDMYGDLGA